MTKFVYRVDEEEPFGTVVDPKTMTHEQLLSAVSKQIVVRCIKCGRYEVVGPVDVEWGDFIIEDGPRMGVS